MEKIVKILKKIDMSDNEIKIYLAILRNPKSNISKISKDS
jgi:sugar-specific transcriptional regulator TrmB